MTLVRRLSGVNRSPKRGPIYSRLVVSAGLALLAACGGGGGSEAGVGVSVEVRHTEPLKSGTPVRWTLVLRNDTPNRLEVEFRSGKDGDVVLRQGSREAYRWSTGRVFTAALRKMTVGANESLTFPLEEPELRVPPGQYRLEATVATSKKVPPAERTVTVTG